MPRIVIAPLAELPDAMARWRPSHVLSIQSPPDTAPPLDGVTHASVTFHDIVDETPTLPDLVHPSPEHANAIARFVEGWDGERPLLIHCRFAVSRSPAAALIAMALREPHARADELMERLRAVAPHATPNARLLAAAEPALGRGNLAAAARAAGRGASVAIGRTVALEVA